MNHLQQTIIGREEGWTILGHSAEYGSDDSGDDDKQAADRFLYSFEEEEEEDGDDDDRFDDGDDDGRFHGFDINDDDSDVGLAKQTRSMLALGYVCGVVAPVLRAVSAGCAQALNGTVPHLQLSFMRYTAQMMFVTPFICARKLSLIPGRCDMLWLVLAAILNNTNNVTYYGACAYLPVVVAGGSMATLSILWATLVTLIVSGKVKIHTAVAVVICIAGIALLVQPKFLFRDLLPAAELSTYTFCGEGAHAKTVPDPMMWGIRRIFYGNSTHNFTKALQGSSGAESETVLNTSDGSNATNHLVGREFDPDLMFDSNFDFENSDDLLESQSLEYEITGFVFIVISSLAAVTVTVIMRYRLNDMHPFVGILWFSVFGMVMSALILPLFSSPAFPDSNPCIAIMFSHSCAASIASILSMISMMLIPPLGFYLLHSFDLLFLASAQYTVLKHLKPGRRNAVEAVGIGLVFLSSLAGPGYSSFKQFSQEEREDENKNKKKNKNKNKEKKKKKYDNGKK